MKNHSMKKKLMATALMLVVSVVMMSTASFAWFTISTAPEVSGMTTEVVVNDNLEIALATSGTTVTFPTAPAADQSGKTQTSWGNIVDLGATADTADGTFDYVKGGDDTTGLDKTLRPIRLNTGKTAFEFPQYGADGRITSFADCKLNDTTGTEKYQFGNLVDAQGNVCAYYVDIWLRTNVAGDIILTSSATDRGTGTNGQGSFFTTSATTANPTATQMFADNLQVAWQLLGTSTPTYTNGALTYNGLDSNSAGATINIFRKTAETNGSDTTANKYLLSSGTAEAPKMFTAVANTAYLVRIYVYLDGTNMQNAGASITGNIVSGALNLQFKHATTLEPMDMPNTNAAG